MRSLIDGFSYPLRAIRFIVGQPVLWRYIVMPIVLNIIVGLALYTTLLWAGFQAIETFLVGWPVWIEWFVRGLLVIALFLGLGYILVRFGVVLGSPFYGRLSELIEERLRGVVRTAPPPTSASVMHDVLCALLFELKKFLLILLIGTPALLLNLIPVVGTLLATGASVTLGVTITCLDFFDPPLERRRLSFRGKLSFIRRHLPASARFGLICLGLVSIPFFNLIAVPICITAGTLFFCEYDNLSR